METRRWHLRVGSHWICLQRWHCWRFLPMWVNRCVIFGYMSFLKIKSWCWLTMRTIWTMFRLIPLHICKCEGLMNREKVQDFRFVQHLLPSPIAVRAHLIRKRTISSYKSCESLDFFLLPPPAHLPKPTAFRFHKECCYFPYLFAFC